MKYTKKIIFIPMTAAFLFVGGAFIVEAENMEANDALAVESASITRYQAVMTALKAVPGKVAKAEFSNDDGYTVWDIEVVSINHQIYDLEIDANNGLVVKNSVDHVDEVRENNGQEE